MDDSEGAEGGCRAITSNGDSGEAEVGREKGEAAATNGESGVSGMEMEIDLEPENTAVEPEPDTGWSVVNTRYLNTLSYEFSFHC